MINVQVFLIKFDGTKYDITNLVGDLKLSNSVDSLGDTFSFNLARSYDDVNLIDFDNIECGDNIIFNKDGTELFRGQVVEEGSSEFSSPIICFDNSFLLNNNKVIEQFKNGISTTGAITRMCQKAGVEIGLIENISTPVKKIYKDKTISEVIDDLLDMATQVTGERYTIRMFRGLLYIEKYAEISTGIELDKTGDVQSSRNVYELKNKVTVVSDNEKSTRIKAVSEDALSQSLYGTLEEVILVDKKQSAQARNIAKTKLAELNKVQQNVTMSVIGKDGFRAGKIVDIEEPRYKLSGKYVIESCEHTYSNGIHLTSLTLEVL